MSRIKNVTCQKNQYVPWSNISVTTLEKGTIFCEKVLFISKIFQIIGENSLNHEPTCRWIIGKMKSQRSEEISRVQYYQYTSVVAYSTTKLGLHVNVKNLKPYTVRYIFVCCKPYVSITWLYMRTLCDISCVNSYI